MDVVWELMKFEKQSSDNCYGLSKFHHKISLFYEKYLEEIKEREETREKENGREE